MSTSISLERTTTRTLDVVAHGTQSPYICGPWFTRGDCCPLSKCRDYRCPSINLLCQRYPKRYDDAIRLHKM